VAAAYTGDPDRLLLVVDGGQGRLRLVLYAQATRREIASIDDVALARYDASTDRVYFSRASGDGLWRADAALGDVVRVSDASPGVQDVRNWGVFEGQPFYIGHGEDCPTVWRPLLAPAGIATCVSREGGAIGGSVARDGARTWLYLGLPSRQNVDIGWTDLGPPSAMGAKPQGEPMPAGSHGNAP
jgi:hypothetical protein